MYLLDTDTRSYVMKRSNAALLDRLCAVEEQAISVISVAELKFGVRLSSPWSGGGLQAFVRHPSFSPGWRCGNHYADIRAGSSASR